MLLEEGSFYSIMDGATHWILEDKTKRGLTVIERVSNQDLTMEDRGRIYDAQGRGYWVAIRLYYPKSNPLEEVRKRAQELEEKYRRLKEETCPE